MTAVSVSIVLVSVALLAEAVAMVELFRHGGATRGSVTFAVAGAAFAFAAMMVATAGLVGAGS